MKENLTLLFLFFLQIVNAQYLEQCEADEYTDYGIIYNSIMYNGSIYIAGKANDNGELDQPCIRKLDTDGNIIWSTTTGDSIASSNRIQEMYHSSDGYLYAFSFSNDHELWKVDTLTGEVIYRYDLGLVYNVLYGLTDYSGDTLLFSFETYIGGEYEHHLAWFDKVAGELLSYDGIPSGAKDFVMPNNDVLFYTSRDTVYRSTPTNVESTTWKTNVVSGGLGNVNLDKLYYNETHDLVYALGDVSVSARGIVACFDAQNGDLLWSVKTESIDNVEYQDLEVEGNNMYVSWRHAYIGGGYYHALIDKIDLLTGDIIWEIEGEYEDGNDGQQAALDLELYENGVYLTGYYDGINYGPGKWGVMKLDKNDGSKIFSTTVSNLSDDHSEGIAVFPLDDKLICIGYIGQQFFSKELYVELNKTSGTILNQKDLGGTALLPSATIALEALSSGKLAVLQQKGRYGYFSIRDLQGNTEWELPILFTSMFEGSSLLVENDSLVLIAGVSGSRIYIVGINPIGHQVLFTTSKSPSQNGDIRVLDILYRHEETIILSTLDHDDGSNFYRFYYNTNNGKWLSSSPEYGTSQFSASYTDRFTNSNLLIELSDNSHFLLRYSGWNELSNSNFDNMGSYFSNGTHNYSHPQVIQDSLIVFTGSSDAWNLCVIRVNRSTLNATNVFEILDFQAKGIKWVEGENNCIIYILSEDNSEVFVTKFDIDNQTVLWTASASAGNANFPDIFATDISYNPVKNYVTVTGFRENLTSNNNQVFFSLITGAGSVVADVTHNGDEPGENQGLTLMSFNNIGTSLIGGQINKDTSISSAFIYYINESNLINAIKGKVFLDQDENGIQNAGEPNIAIGDINIDNEYQTYLNSNGYFQTIPDPGLHTVTYNLSPDWALTSDSLTFHLDTNDPNTPNDTLCFGIKPENIVDHVEPFVIAQPLVCNQVSPFLIQIINTGTTVQDVILKLNFDGSFVYAVPEPDSIDTNNIYWSYYGLNPGESRVIDLGFQMPGVDNIGELLSFKAFAYLYDSNGQIITDSFEYFYQDILLCAYDPNDKHVNPVGVGEDDLTLFDQYLNYTIRFQNTGNYLAKDVAIIDTLDTDLDLSTFEFIAASHDITEINRTGNVLEFIFSNIYLPDSLNNEPESHGFVSFRIKPKENLPEGTRIINVAHIYFDQNPAIVTNTTRNILVSDLTPIIQIQNDKNVLYKVYPNPTSGELFVESLYASPNPINWNLFDILGRRIKSGKLERNQQRLNLIEIKAGIYFLEINQGATFKIIITN